MTCNLLLPASLMYQSDLEGGPFSDKFPSVLEAHDQISDLLFCKMNMVTQSLMVVQITDNLPYLHVFSDQSWQCGLFSQWYTRGRICRDMPVRDCARDPALHTNR